MTPVFGKSERRPFLFRTPFGPCLRMAPTKKPAGQTRRLCLWEGSGLVDALLEGLLDVALDLLRLALAFLDLAFLAHALIAGSLTDTLFDLAHGFVAHATCLVTRAAHVGLVLSNGLLWVDRHRWPRLRPGDPRQLHKKRRVKRRFWEEPAVRACADAPGTRGTAFPAGG